MGGVKGYRFRRRYRLPGISGIWYLCSSGQKKLLRPKKNIPKALMICCIGVGAVCHLYVSVTGSMADSME